MNAHSSDLAAYEALLAFWHEAGVDACYLDEPIDHTVIQPLPTPAAVQKLAAVQPVRAPAGQTRVDAGVPLARQLAAQANTLDELIGAVAAFDGCGLKMMGAKNALFGRGAADADLLVIADAPTGEDDDRNQPFSGPSARLLERILGAAGVAEKTYLTQTVFWQPPGNRPPTPEEQAVCLPFIERAVQLIQPKAVLLIGAVAVRGILSSQESLLRLQGRWQEWTPHGHQTLPVMTTFHPGFLLQQPLAKGAVWRDMLAVAARL